MTRATRYHDYLIASDFDKTLSFNDSGIVLSDILGIADFESKVTGLAGINLVQQGAELAYLLRHDPCFRRARRDDMIAAGRRVRLKHNVALLMNALSRELDGCRFHFYVISAGAAEVVRSALDGIVPADHIYGAEFEYDPAGEISNLVRVPAGYGKVAVLEELEAKLNISPDRTIYIGDGVSDLYVMQHVNSRAGHTIAVSETKCVGRVAQRTVLSDNALSVMVPILEEILGWNSDQIRDWFASCGLAVHGWDKVRTDWLTFQELPAEPEAPTRDGAAPEGVVDIV